MLCRAAQLSMPLIAVTTTPPSLLLPLPLPLPLPQPLLVHALDTNSSQPFQTTPFHPISFSPLSPSFSTYFSASSTPTPTPQSSFTVPHCTPTQTTFPPPFDSNARTVDGASGTSVSNNDVLNKRILDEKEAQLAAAHAQIEIMTEQVSQNSLLFCFVLFRFRLFSFNFFHSSISYFVPFSYLVSPLHSSYTIPLSFILSPSYTIPLSYPRNFPKCSFIFFLITFCTTNKTPFFSSLHSTSLHLTSLHFTSLHFTSPHLTSPYFTSLHFTSPHSTSLHLTSLHFTIFYFSWTITV